MAPVATKRAAPYAQRKAGSKKRQKIEPPTPAAAPAQYSDVRKQPVAIDSLPWNEVQLPEMFDDAEGFFGLEEVEGVEVVREGDHVKFVSRKVKMCCMVVLTLSRFLPNRSLLNMTTRDSKDLETIQLS